MIKTCRALSTCLVLMGFGLSHEVNAAILTVTNLAVSGTLRAQVAAADDTIILTSSGDIAINKNLTIDGPGTSRLTVSRTSYGTSLI